MKRIVFNGQLLQDRWVACVLGKKKNGWFLDIGAGDGHQLSNTFYLEKELNWNGLCIEPGLTFADLKDCRSCFVDNACLYSETGLQVDYCVDNDDLFFSGIASDLDRHQGRPHKIVRKETTALNDVLSKYDLPVSFDYMSLDTEGSELKILQGTDLERFKFSLISVEHNHEEPKRSDIKKLLESYGYTRLCEIAFDDWYALRSSFSSSQILRARTLSYFFLFHWRVIRRIKRKCRSVFRAARRKLKER